MITWRCITKLSLWFALTSVTILGAEPANSQDMDTPPGNKTKVEVQLTESFYYALSAEGGKTYSTNKSDEYLRQIAVSSKFMVETNLRVIENQQRIIELLESLQKSPAP